MWYVLRTSTKSEADFTSSALALLHTTARTLIVAVLLIFVCWHFVVVATWPETQNWQSWVVLLVLSVTSILALWMMPALSSAGANKMIAANAMSRVLSARSCRSLREVGTTVRSITPASSHVGELILMASARSRPR